MPGPGRATVGYPVAPLMQAHIVLARDRTRDEAGFVQQLPEPVRVAGKVVTGQRRAHRVDPDEQDAHPGPNPIGEPQVLPVSARGFRILRHGSESMAFQGRADALQLR